MEPAKAGAAVKAGGLFNAALLMKVVFVAGAVAILAGFLSVAIVYGFPDPAPVPDWADRTVHLAVEEVLHDYAPSGRDLCYDVAVPDSEAASTFLLNDPGAGYIGAQYWRRHYTRYEPDGTFSKPMTTESAADPAWEHLGALGPILRAHAGDMLRVRLRNRSRFPASFHVHGLHYYSIALVEDTPATGGGAPQPGTVISAVLNLAQGGTAGAGDGDGKVLVDTFSGGTRSVLCDSKNSCDDLAAVQGANVPPGGTLEYSILVPDEAGPGEGEPSSVARLYQSLSYQGHDVALSGMLVVTPRTTRKNPTKAPAPARPADVHAEAALLYSVSNENDSPYLGLNVLDFVMRGRVAEAGPHLAREIAAIDHGSAFFPLPNATSPGAIVSALYNAAVGVIHGNASLLPSGGLTEEEVDEETAAVIAAAGPAGTVLTGTTAVTVNTLLGVRLGLRMWAGQTHHSYMLIVDAREYVARYGQVTAETALGDLALAGLEGEEGFDAGVFEESNLMHSVNGRLYCNVPGLEYNQGETVRWYTAVVGTEVDLHAVHWHGNTVLDRGRRSDSIPLLPRQVVTTDMAAHSPGTWMLHCHVTDHIHAGMIVLYTVKGSATTTLNMRRVGGTGTVAQAAPTSLAPYLNGRLREYFVQAEVADWEYWDAAAHHPGNAGSEPPACGAADVEGLSVDLNGTTTFPKAIYTQYTDATWTTPVPRPAAWEHLGVLGPIIRAEVGDVIKITFRNKTPRPFSMHPHGVAYGKGGEGAPYNDGTSGSAADTGDDAVQPNASWTFSWFVPDSAGPGPADPESIPWLYHGHVHETSDENAGMIGVILVTGRGKARVPGGSSSLSSTDLVPSGVDREFVVLSKVFEEGDHGIAHGHRQRRMLAEEEAGHHAHAPSAAQRSRALAAAAEEGEPPLLYALNGKLACSLPGLEAEEGQNVRWYFVSLGNEIDLHHLSVTGHTMTYSGHRQAGMSLMPGTMFSTDMKAGAAGDWLLTSSVRHHAERGMVATFTVTAPGSSGGHGGHGGSQAPHPSPTPAPGGSLREYFIAAEEAPAWNYAPANEDLCVPGEARASTEADSFPALPEDERYDADGLDLNAFPGDGRLFIGRGLENGTTIGGVYKKALYVAYADASFGQVLYRPGQAASTSGLRSSATGPGSASRGLLGPTIRAAVGDVLVITFRNRLTFPTNLVFAHGPVITHLVAGVRGSDPSTWTVPENVTTPAEMADWPVPPGWDAQYTWTVPAESGPAAKDPSTIAWPYLSTVDSNHLYAGLVGPAIIAASPAALAPGFPAHGADREYVLAWFIHNENSSPYLEDNILAKVVNPEGADVEDETFQESNLMHAVNGRLFCNLEGLTATLGQTVRMHMLGLGAELDMHTPQVHGTLLTISRGRDGAGKTIADAHAGVVPLHPGASVAVDFKAEAAGSWLLECGVNDHWATGMRASLQVNA